MQVFVLLAFMIGGFILAVALLRKAGFEYYEVIEDSENEK